MEPESLTAVKGLAELSARACSTAGPTYSLLILDNDVREGFKVGLLQNMPV